MAYTTMLNDGHTDMVQNTVYALPGKTKWVVSDLVLEVAETTGGTFVAVAATTTVGARLPGAGFVRCTTGNASAIMTNP